MKLLHIGLYTKGEEQITMRAALEGISSFYTECSYAEDAVKAKELFRTADWYDVVFMQIQSGGVIDIKKAKELKDKGVLLVNFTGDVRQPLPEWYLALAPYVTTVFTNMHDVEYVRSFGYDAEYVQIGYNENIYKKEGVREKKATKIVFMGNNYGRTFPLSEERHMMVNKLKRKYGDNFKVYGSGWERGTENLNHRQEREAEIYRGAKIAINFSHFNLSRYSSDRIFRIMGCGTLCLTHRFKDMEDEFKDGVHLVAWDNLTDLCNKIDYYLAHEKEARDIAEAGQYLCENTATWEKRIETLKNIIDERMLHSSIQKQGGTPTEVHPALPKINS